MDFLNCTAVVLRARVMSAGGGQNIEQAYADFFFLYDEGPLLICSNKNAARDRMAMTAVKPFLLEQLR